MVSIYLKIWLIYKKVVLLQTHLWKNECQDDSVAQ